MIRVSNEVKHRPQSETYLTVLWDDDYTHLLQLLIPRRKNHRVQIDARIVPELIIALNDACRDSGHAYLKDCGRVTTEEPA